jgi:vacuolar-type H+-ATPase subunit H
MSELANSLYFVESDARKNLRELEDHCAYLVETAKLEWLEIVRNIIEKANKEAFEFMRIARHYDELVNGELIEEF